jgi:hypothetical protein
MVSGWLLVSRAKVQMLGFSGSRLDCAFAQATMVPCFDGNGFLQAQDGCHFADDTRNGSRTAVVPLLLLHIELLPRGVPWVTSWDLD